MLTNTSGINNVTGYQAQLDISSATQVSKNDEKRFSSDRKESSDTVSISRKAQALQQTYHTEKTTLEQNFDSDVDQLEREYAREKNQLERAFKQKKQNLEIHVYA